MNSKPTQKDFWKAQMLEFFHNYFIGISNLECSEDNCPLVSDKIALESIHNLLNYIQQSNSLSVNSSVLSGMKDLQRQIRKKQVDSLICRIILRLRCDFYLLLLLLLKG